MMKEIRILVLVIVCGQYVDFSYSYSFCLKMKSILVTVTDIVIVIVLVNDVCFTCTLYHHYYAHAYSVPNASSLHQSVYEYTIPTYWEQF